MGSWVLYCPVVCWLMASCIQCQRGACSSLPLVLLLVLLHSGQQAHHNSITTSRPTTAKTLSTTTIIASTDGSNDPGKNNDTLAIVCCPSDGETVRVNLSSGESHISNLTCNSSASNFSNSQCAVCVFESSTLPLLSQSSCMWSEPVENLTAKGRTNNSITLHWQHSSDLCSVTAQVSGLIAGQSYNMTVCRFRNGNCSQNKSIHDATQPSPVLKVETEKRTVNSLEIRWTPPEDRHTENYNYAVGRSNTTSIHNCSLPNRNPCDVSNPDNHHQDTPYIISLPNCSFPASRTCNVSDLEAGVMYKVVVWVIANNIYSIPTCIDATTVPNKPTNVLVNGTPYNTHNLSISWVRPKDCNARHYEYRLSWAHENDTRLIGNESTNGTSYVLDRLQPGKLYLVNLSSWINGVPSASVSEWALTAPLPPKNFRVVYINQTDAALSWEPQNPVSHFDLYWQKMQVGLGERKTVRTSEKVPVNGLIPGTNYTFVVVSVAKGKNQTMTSTEVQLQKSTKPAQVDTVDCLPLEWGCCLLVSWTYPEEYGVTTFQVSVVGLSRHITVHNETSVVVRELHPASPYQIVVTTFWYDEQEKSKPQKCDTSSTGVVIGAVCLVMLSLIILGLLLFYFWRRGKNILGKLKTAEESLSAVAPVPVSAFPCYCSEHLSDSAFGFAQEYQQLQDVGTGQPCNVAQRPENQVKNRYSNVLPYDNSRVLLTSKPGDPNSDYINASYLPGYKSSKEFIAAQGPLPGTLHDFWRMIWEQRITTLVMLTKCVESGRVKCEHYWPLDYTPCVYDNITVSVVTETILPDWTIRDFRIKQTNEPEVRLARHYHYTSWPDHQVPKVTKTILHFRDLVREHIEQQEGSRPALVHCSAGVGRTGTFIALDSLLRQAQNEGELGVFAFVQRMRMHRPLMIQTESQYIFLYQCLLDGIWSSPQNDREKLEYAAVYENILALQGYEVTRV